MDKGLLYCDGFEIYLETLKGYAESTGKNIYAMRTSFEQGNFDTFGVEIHALKSSSKMIGADDLSELCHRFEIAIEEHNDLYIGENIDRLCRIYSNLSEKILHIFKNEEKNADIDAESVPALFSHLNNYVVNRNNEATGSMLRALSNYSFSGEYQDIFNSLKKSYELLDWEAMQKILDDVLK